MEKVNFVCPECGNGVCAPRVYRGREVECLACEALVRVPVNAARAAKRKRKDVSAGDQVVNVIKLVLVLGLVWVLVVEVLVPLL